MTSPTKARALRRTSGAARRTGAALLAGLVMAVAFTGVGARTARAATAFRYWAFYVASGSSWVYSQRGPAYEYPKDAEVQGWRLAVQTETGGAAPRSAPDFATLCGHTAASGGRIRVGIVLDFGTAADAPPGDSPPHGVVTGCVSVADGASGADVLAAAVGSNGFRIGTGSYAGMVCGIDGYPRSGCATPATPAATHPPAPAAPTPSSAPTHTTQPAAAGVATPTTRTPSPAATASAAAASSSTAASPPVAATSSAIADAPASSAARSESLAVARSRHRSGSFPIAPVLGGLLVVALAGAALWRARSARQAGR